MGDVVADAFLAPAAGRGLSFGRLLRSLVPREGMRGRGRPAAEVRELRADLADARTRLTQRESYLQALLETIDVGIISCDAQAGGWTRNRAGRLLLGLDNPTARGLSPQDAAPHMDVHDAHGVPVPVTEYPLLRALRGEPVGAVELRLGPAGGPLREVISLNSQILDTDGAVLGAVCALTDVSVERAAIRAVAEQHARLSEAQRIGQLGSFEFDAATRRWVLSRQMRVLWGLPAVDTSDAHPVDQELVHPDDRAHATASWASACERPGTHTFEFRIHRADDAVERRLRCSVEVEVAADGSAAPMRGTNLDITEVTAAVQSAQAATSFLDAVITASPDYTFVTELSSGAVAYGSKSKNVLGISSDQLVALGAGVIAALVHPDDADGLRAVNVAAAEMADGAVLQTRFRAKHTDGRWRWIHRRVTPFTRDASGTVLQVVGVMRDITDQVLVEERLMYASQHDGLTTLPNRSCLMDRLQASLDRSARDGHEVTVLFCDLDGFKHVNDSSGHAAGDAVLRVTGRRIAAILRETDMVARVGGDEFVVIIEPVEPALRPVGDTDQACRDRNRTVALQVASRITAAVRRPVRYAGTEHVVTASIGMTFASHTSADRGGLLTADSVLKRADDLMYRAKARGKDRVEVITAS